MTRRAFVQALGAGVAFQGPLTRWFGGFLQGWYGRLRWGIPGIAIGSAPVMGASGLGMAVTSGNIGHMTVSGSAYQLGSIALSTPSAGVDGMFHAGPKGKLPMIRTDDPLTARRLSEQAWLARVAQKTEQRGGRVQWMD